MAWPFLGPGFTAWSQQRLRSSPANRDLLFRAAPTKGKERSEQEGRKSVKSRVSMRPWKTWLGLGIVAVAVALVGGPYVYIHFIEGKAPPPLTLATPSVTSSADGATSSGQAAGASDGTWNVSSGSLVGYRVNEVLFGQSNVAVGRASGITGSITVNGTTITAGSFKVDMTTVGSDQSRRDGQFNGRIMETSSYPTAAFSLTDPIDLGSIPAQGAQRTYEAKGSLTLHGVTRTVMFKVTGRYSGSTFQVSGSIPIRFADWKIPNPSFGPVSTEDHGVLEFALNFAQAG
jgi:polyisoprenoid-binding protein YceI